nr:hypothetical protein [Tanacetum cinerariifolium]
GNSQINIDDKGYWDSGCSRHMTGNISYLSDYEPFDGGYVSFGQGGCKITGKGIIKTDGKSRTISESLIRRNLKLRDEAGISSLPNAELFKNLTLMGYNILPNQKFSFQKGQFSHQWKYLIHTIMQCLSPKSTGFNEFSSNIASALMCLATNRLYNFSKMIFDGMVRNVNNKVSKFLMYPRVNSPSFLRRTVPLFPSMLVTISEGSCTPTEPHHTPSLEAQQTSLTATSSPSLLPVTTATITTVIPTHTPNLGNTPEELGLLNAPIKGRSLDEGEEEAIERGNDDTKEMVNVLTTLDAASILTSGVSISISPVTEVSVAKVPIGSDFIPTASPPVSVAEVPIGSDSIPTASPPGAGVPIVSVLTGSDVVPTTKTPKKKKLQEQIDVEMARQLEEEMARDAQRMNEQIAKDAEIARIHAEEELQMMIDGLDKSNEMIAKHLHEYDQAAAELTIGEKIELINELVKYQDHLASIQKLEKKHFKGMSLEEIREKFDPVWKQFQEFVPIGSKEEKERFKRKGLRLEQDSAKKVKTSEEVSEEDLKAIMKLVPVEELWALVKETLNIRQATSDKEKELWVELKSCGVHHVLSKDQEIFMLVEKEYPLRKGLAIAMIINKLQVENYFQMANDLIQKIYKIANSPSQRSD